MIQRFFVSYTLLAAAVTCLQAQLYVIAGSGDDKRPVDFRASLVQVGDDGTVTEAESLFSTDFNAGLAWVGYSAEARKVVLSPHGERDTFVVVDFGKAASVKTCEIPSLPMPVAYSRLVDLPGRGLAFVEQMFGGGHEKLVGFVLDPATPCEESAVDMAPTDILGLQVHGLSGVSDTGTDDTDVVYISAQGVIQDRALGVDFGLVVPANLLAGLRQPMARILVDNPVLVAIGLFETAGPHRILVYRKQERSWRRLPVPNERVLIDGRSTPTPWLTGFGDFLALSEAQTKDVVHLESAGKSEWRKTAADTGPSIAARLSEQTVVFPGKLHLYDTARDRSYTINTDQADSEILLVDGGAVYYRICDAIYRAPLESSGLGPPRLVARAPVLEDAHWAFLRHP